MLKESTRKGWAGVLAAGLAVAGLSVGAAPAQAVPTSITISPIVGTNTNALSGAHFVLKTAAIGSVDTEDIRYQIEGALASDFTTVSVVNTTDITAGGNTAIGSVTMDIETKVTDDLISVLDPDGTSARSVDAAWQQGEYQLLFLNMTTTSAKTITITPFVEDVADGVITPGEKVGNALTVTFHPATDITATTALSLGAVGDNPDTSTITFSDVNMASLQELAAGTPLGLTKWTKNGGTPEVISIDAADYNPGAGAFRIANTSNDVHSLDAGDVLVGASKVLTESYGAGDLKIMGDSDNASLDANLVFAPQSGVLAAGSATTADIAAGAGSFTVTANANAKDGKSAAGETVTFTIKENAIAGLGSGSVTVGSTTLTNAKSTVSEDIKVTAITDADGDAEITVSYTGLKDGNAFNVTASANVGANGTTSTAIFTAADRTPTTVVNNDRAGGSQIVTMGSTTTHTFTILDQFGDAYTAAPTKLRYTYNSNTGNTPASATGVHTISLTDNNVGLTATEAETLDIGSYDITTGANLTSDVAFGSSLEVPVQVFPSTLPTIGRVVIGAESADAQSGTSADIKGATLPAVDTALTVDFSAEADHSFDVTAYSSTGAVMPGAMLTVTAPSDVLLGDGTRQAFGSLQVRTDAAGKATINFDSNSDARKTITVTSGSASDTTFFDFSPITAHTAVSAITIDGPDTVAPGSTAKFVATLKDKWGNPVNTTADSTGDNFLFSYSGPGLVVGSQPTETGSDGTATISVLMGSNESGTATVTLRTDTDGSAATLTGRQTVSKSVTIGTAAGAFTGTYGDVSAWTVLQDDGTAKVYVKFPTVGDKVRIGHQTGGSGSYETIYVKTTSSETMDGLNQVAGVGTYVVRTIDLDSGTNRIRVTVGDDTLVQVRYNQ